MKFIDVMGKTIESAVEEGLKELGTTSDNVEITVLKQPGMFSKAKVRLTLVENENASIDNNDAVSNESLETSDTKIDEKTSEPTTAEIPQEENVEAPSENTAEDTAENTAEDTQVAEKPNNQTVWTNEILGRSGNILKQICELISDKIQIKQATKNHIIIYELSGENSDKLIGREGKAIESLQLILNSINRHKDNDHRHITIRISDYEATKEKRLEKLAYETADKAVAENKTIRMNVMNSYERRIVHAFLQQDSRVETESFGVEPYRYITVRPKETKEN